MLTLYFQAPLTTPEQIRETASDPNLRSNCDQCVNKVDQWAGHIRINFPETEIPDEVIRAITVGPRLKAVVKTISLEERAAQLQAERAPSVPASSNAVESKSVVRRMFSNLLYVNPFCKSFPLDDELDFEEFAAEVAAELTAQDVAMPDASPSVRPSLF